MAICCLRRLQTTFARLGVLLGFEFFEIGKVVPIKGEKLVVTVIQVVETVRLALYWLLKE